MEGFWTARVKLEVRSKVAATIATIMTGSRITTRLIASSPRLKNERANALRAAFTNGLLFF
jgi:hypothetical protein